MTSPRILIVEDDAALARFLELELTHEGYCVVVAGDGERGLRAALAQVWDAVLLDVLLPRLTGVEVCRRLRAASGVPVIMLTARDTVPDRVSGLDAGADDYLVKPFAIEELLARLRACLRRSEEQTARGPLVIADLRLDPARRTVSRAEQPIELTKTEFDLLACLMSHPGIVLTREALLREVWGYDYLGGSNIVDVYIGYVRAKADTPFGRRVIHTVRGVGYVLKEE